MNLKQLINKSVYGTVGYISSNEDLDILESYIMYNLPILKEFKQIIVATNFSNGRSYPSYQTLNDKLWKKYFPDCIILNSNINRGHNFGTADLDNMLFDFCKENEIEWLFKTSNDVVFTPEFLEISIEEADFYYMNGISALDVIKNKYNYSEVFYPQTNYYFINVSKCDYLNNKKYLDETYIHSKSIPNYTGKIWDYIDGWSCENFLKQCVERNNLTKYNLISKKTHDYLCWVISTHNIGDPSHKNIMIKGICHFHYPKQNIIEI